MKSEKTGHSIEQEVRVKSLKDAGFRHIFTKVLTKNHRREFKEFDI